MQGTPQIHVAEDVYLELPPEHILSALGTNYNALVRTWTLRQYQLHLEHHQKMAHYYQQCIRRFEDLEVRYEREPEQPIAAVASGPIKLSDLAKQRPAYVPQAKPSVAQSPAAASASGPSSNIKSFDSAKSGTTLSSSLAAKEVKLDKKPKPINVEVEMDAEEREALQEPEMEHFSRPQPKRKNNKRTDIQKLDDNVEEDEVSTWQENPGAFSGGKGGAGGEKSGIKSAFSGLKSSLFNKEKKDDGRESANMSRESTNTTTTTTSSPTPQPNTYQQWSSPSSSSGASSPNQFGIMSGPPALKPSGPPPIQPNIPPTLPTSSNDSGSSAGGPPPRLFIPPPPPTPTHGPK